MNINHIRFPDRHLIKQERHIQQAHQDEGRRVLSILSGRGCCFRCDFCISHEIWGRHPRIRDAKNVVWEMEQVIEDWKPDFIKFSDDTFSISWKRNAELFDYIRDRNINIEWGCNVHPNTVNQMKLEAMWDAGCREIWVGVESGSARLRAEMGKCTGYTGNSKTKIWNSNARLINLFQTARKIGLKTRAYWLIGHPKETLKDLLATKDLSERLLADINGVTILCPFPGTEHFNEDEMRGWDWSECDEYWNPYWSTEHFTNYQLKQHQKGLVRHFEEFGELVIKHKRLYHG